jgi:hypothetical protein
MKTPLIAGGLLIMLAMGFLIGRLSSGDGITKTHGTESRAGREGTRRTRTSERQEKEISSSNTQRLRNEIRKASPGALAILVYRPLELSDPLERRQLLLDIFSRMDAGNFEAMIREAERNSLETGRNNYDEWAVMLVRSGQVGGQAAMELWSGDLRRNWDQLMKTMQGWASNDPGSAMRWIEQKDLPPQTRMNMIGAFMAGAIAKDGVQALALLDTLSEQDRLTSVQWTTQFLTQSSGKDSLVEWMKSVNASHPGTPYADKVTASVFDKIVWSGANQFSIPTVVADLERISSVIPMDDQRLVRAIAQVGAREPVRGIDLLDQLARSPLMKDRSLPPMLVSQATEGAIRKERGEVEKWLAANPGSPIHGKVAEALEKTPPPQPEAANQ